MPDDEAHAPAEQDPPSHFARLSVELRPDTRVTGAVPPDQTRHLITTVCLMVTAGVGGAAGVLILRISASLGPLALAELIFALVTVAVIAACSVTETRRPQRAAGDSRGPHEAWPGGD